MKDLNLVKVYSLITLKPVIVRPSKLTSIAMSSWEALMIWSIRALSFTANRTVVVAWYQPEYGLFLSAPPTNPQPQQENSGSGGFTSRLDDRPAEFPDPGSPLFQY